MNNKFGECCNCPALMADGRLFTQYTNRRHYNTEIMRMMNVNNSHQYRTVITNNGVKLINNINTQNNNSLKCVNSNGNTFYSTPDINAHFDKNHENELKQPSDLSTNYMMLNLS